MSQAMAEGPLTVAKSRIDDLEADARELKARRNEVASRLRDVRTAPDGAWREPRDRVLDALDELDHSAGTA